MILLFVMQTNDEYNMTMDDDVMKALKHVLINRYWKLFKCIATFV